MRHTEPDRITPRYRSRAADPPQQMIGPRRAAPGRHTETVGPGTDGERGPGTSQWSSDILIIATNIVLSHLNWN